MGRCVRRAMVGGAGLLLIVSTILGVSEGHSTEHVVGAALVLIIAMLATMAVYKVAQGSRDEWH